MGELPIGINIQEPRWDQSTFLGRARHFFTVTDPRNLLLSGSQLEASRNIVQNYRQLGTAYVSATTGAVATALGLKSLTKHLPTLVGRFVPFAAVAAANCINIPLMRQRELQVGIPVTDEEGQRLGHSVTAAKQGIFQVVVSRICMAIPAMAIPPLIMDTLEKKDFLKHRPWLGAPLQVGLVGFCLVFATPLCCALFPQRSSIHVSRLEPELRAQIHEQSPSTEVVYYNKGL
ncbi:sideroflexin-3 isoform X4 [Manis javanica]|uniref:sideroflexin-3 isoform X4 n=1 Tax=Manis javanica TaxID=9974 RepID=UPI003C6CF4C1